MTATSTRGIVLPLIALVAAFAVAIFFAIQHLLNQRPADTRVDIAAPVNAKPVDTKPAAAAHEQTALATVQAEAKAVVAALAGSSAPKGDAGVPSFDIARIEPSGDTVIAGRATPGATVELLRDGEPHDRVVVDQSGQFAMVPPRLPAGTYTMTLRATQPDGKQILSSQSVAVALAPNPARPDTTKAGASDPPVVALITPGKPTVVLSQPSAAKPGSVVVEAVEIQPGGKLHVSGRARPGAATRFYLNDSYLASATADADGRFAITINEGVAPGDYRVRLDEVESASGAVRARAEVPFNVPANVATASVQSKTVAPAQAAASTPAPAMASKPQQTAAAQPDRAAAPPTQAAAQPTQASAPASSGTAATQPEAAASTPATASPSVVVVPKITTATVVRGDSLWRISQTTYGAGIRYAVIYEANQKQIRDPDLIYPGQIFVLPAQ